MFSHLWINIFHLACLVWECSRILEFLGFLSKDYTDFLCLLCIEKVSSHQMGSYLESDPLSVYPHVLNNRTLV